MFIFCLEGKLRPEIASFVDNVVLSNQSFYLYCPLASAILKTGLQRKGNRKKKDYTNKATALLLVSIHQEHISVLNYYQIKSDDLVQIVYATCGLLLFRD